MPTQEPTSTDGKSKPELPKLVFRPDEKRTTRVVVLRRLLMWTTIGILGIGLFILARYRPRPLTAAQPQAESTRSAVELVPARAESGSSQPRVGVRADPIRQTIARVQTAIRDALGQWRRAAAVVPVEQVTADNATQLLAQVNAVSPLLDSARGELADAQAGNVRLEELSRSFESREAYRLSVVCAEAADYLKLLQAEAGDQDALFGSMVASCRAALGGDQDEATVKQNVANSFLRKSEGRQKSLARRASRFDEVVQNYYR
jgi:hypothetical protein